MGGEGSGPQKKPATLIKEAKENDVKNLPKYFERLSELALNGDREALFYLVDRHMGKTKGTIEIEGVEHLGEGVILNLLTLFAQQRQNKPVIQLEEGKDATEQG